MKSRLFSILLLSAALCTPSLLADDADQFLLRPAPGALQRVLQRYGLELKKSLPSKNLYLVQPHDDDNIEDSVRGDRDVISIEKNENVLAPEVESGSTSPDNAPLEQALLGRRIINYHGMRLWEGFTQQPAFRNIGLPQAQSRSRTGSGTVAVIDTGVDPSHPALEGSLVNGFDFTTDQSGNPTDWASVSPEVRSALSDFKLGVETGFQSTTAFIDNSSRPVPINQYLVAALTQSTTAFIDTGKLPQAFGHGTMVASLVRLAAPTAKIMPLKAFRSDGSSNTFDLIRAIYYATDNGANVINMSFNMKVNSPELTRAIDYAFARKVILVASAGNDGNEILVFPAASPKVMGIASVTPFGQRSGFSNYGPGLVTLSAPGEGVIVAYPGNNYASAWGTSFSTPLVSGAVALLLQRNSSLTALQIEAEMKRQARPTSDYGLGAGLLFVGNF
jgi:subtilisin family serine protease